MIFYPKSYFKNILEIDMNFIEKNNIKAILLDIDNTMIDTDNNILEGLEDWVEEAKKHGIKFCILSNTNKKKNLILQWFMKNFLRNIYYLQRAVLN